MERERGRGIGRGVEERSDAKEEMDEREKKWEKVILDGVEKRMEEVLR